MEYEDDLLLTCTASGGSNNMFYWFKDGVYLGGRTDGVLNITDVTADDGGLYECVVNNTAGNSSADITIYGMSFTCISLITLLTMQYCFLFSYSTFYYCTTKCRSIHWHHVKLVMFS